MTSLGNKQASPLQEVKPTKFVRPEKRQVCVGQYWKQAEQGWPSGSGVNVGFDNFEFGDSFDDFINELLGRFGSTGASTGPNRSQSPAASTGALVGLAALTVAISLALKIVQQLPRIEKQRLAST